MGLSFLFIALCLIVGGVLPLAMRTPGFFPSIGSSLKEAELKRFSPKKTLFIIGPTTNHPACKLQRRLLKPAIAALIREDVTVMEIYGEDQPRKNGEPVDWLDSSLLRHAMDAEAGFFVIYVDEHGKTTLRSEAPIVTVDLLSRARLDIPSTPAAPSRRRSAVLRRLSAA